MDASSIGLVISALIGSVNAEKTATAKQIEITAEMADGITAIQNNQPKRFFYSMAYPLEQAILGLVEINGHPTHDDQFLFSHFGFVKEQFMHLIVKYEGSACSVDKASTILNSIPKFMQTGREIEFDYSQQYTFHLPKKVFTKHQEIIDFYRAVIRLYYGNPTAFIELHQSICQRLDGELSKELVH